MRCLTVQQPWAWAIFHGKLVENRTQLWGYRGTLAIHAGSRWSDRGGDSRLIRDAFREAAPDYKGPYIPEWLFKERMPGVVSSAIIGLVDLVDCHPEAGCCAPWGESSYVEHGGRERRRVTHLVLESPRELPEPIPCRGALGLWNPPADVAALIGDATAAKTRVRKT